MAETLVQFKKSVDKLIEQGEKKEVAIMHAIQKYIVESKPILFEGDGYSETWEKEAKKRTLGNVKTTPLALDALINNKAKSLFTSHKIYTEAELEARHEILLETYIKKIQIEARVIGDLASTYIIPAALKYQNILLENIRGLKEIGFNEDSFSAQKQIVAKLSEHINVISTGVKEMINARKKANQLAGNREKAIAYCDKVKCFFDNIRYHADKLELLVDDELWELPKYRELLFLR